MRLWRGDPCYLEYKTLKWPSVLRFYDSDAKTVVEALNEFYHLHPDEPFYGFIADDIVLRTKGGLEHLQALAHPFFIAYPNDTLQRERLCTHFCIGGDLVRLMNWFVYPKLEHNYIDNVWCSIGVNTGLLRYAPQVIFQHKHFLVGSAPWDETYSASYSKGAKQPDTLQVRADEDRWEEYVKKHLEEDVLKVKKELFVACEDWEAWQKEDEDRGLLSRNAA